MNNKNLTPYRDRDVDFKGVSELEQFKSNPFIPNSEVKTTRKYSYFKKDGEQIVNLRTGEVTGFSMLVRNRVVDDERFVKLYTRHLSSWLNVSKKAQRVLWYILQVLKKDQDFVMIDWDDIREVSGYNSHRPIYEALAELCARDLLARSTSKIIYYINPAFVFNGDRVAFADMISKETAEPLPGISSDGPADPMDFLSSSTEKKEAPSGASSSGEDVF